MNDSIKGQKLEIFPANPLASPIYTLYFEGVRLNPSDVPKGMGLWHVREDPESGELLSVEKPHILVNFAGSLLVPELYRLVPNWNGTLFDFEEAALVDEIDRLKATMGNPPSDAEKAELDELNEAHRILDEKRTSYGFEDYSYSDDPPMTVEEFVEYIRRLYGLPS